MCRTQQLEQNAVAFRFWEIITICMTVSLKELWMKSSFIFPITEGIHVAKAIEQYEAIGIAVNLNLQIYDVNFKMQIQRVGAFGDYYVITFKESVFQSENESC